MPKSPNHSKKETKSALAVFRLCFARSSGSVNTRINVAAKRNMVNLYHPLVPQGATGFVLPIDCQTPQHIGRAILAVSGSGGFFTLETTSVCEKYLNATKVRVRRAKAANPRLLRHRRWTSVCRKRSIGCEGCDGTKSAAANAADNFMRRSLGKHDEIDCC